MMKFICDMPVWPICIAFIVFFVWAFWGVFAVPVSITCLTLNLS